DQVLLELSSCVPFSKEPVVSKCWCPNDRSCPGNSLRVACVDLSKIVRPLYHHWLRSSNARGYMCWQTCCIRRDGATCSRWYCDTLRTAYCMPTKIIGCSHRRSLIARRIQN